MNNSNAAPSFNVAAPVSNANASANAAPVANKPAEEKKGFFSGLMSLFGSSTPAASGGARRSRKAHRKGRKASRKARKASRKSRKSRRNNRK